jgi:hypothetical protein
MDGWDGSEAADRFIKKVIEAFSGSVELPAGGCAIHEGPRPGCRYCKQESA